MALVDNFPDAQEYLGARYVLRRVTTFCDEVDGIGRRAVTVRIQRLFGEGQRWFAFSALICVESAANASAALRYNARLPVGALVSSCGACWLRVVVPSPTPTETFDEILAYLADEAARILEIPEPSQDIFANMAD